MLREFSNLQEENQEAIQKVDESVKDHEKVVKSMNENHSRLEKKLAALTVWYLDPQLLVPQNEIIKLTDRKSEVTNNNVTPGPEEQVGARISDPKRREKSVGKGAIRW